MTEKNAERLPGRESLERRDGRSCGIFFTVCAPPSACVEVGLSFGMPGCGALSRQEETWEERAKIEGGRAEGAAGISEEFFHPGVSYLIDWRAGAVAVGGGGQG